MANSQLFAFTATCVILFFIETSLSSAAIAQTMEVPGAGIGAGRTQYCEYYNATSCPTNSSSCYEREECESHDPLKRNHCFVLWTKNKTSGATIVSLKGCFLDTKECYDKPECVEESYRPKGMYFCCCEGDLCNRNFTWSPAPTEATVVKVGTEPVQQNYTLIVVLCFVGVILVLVACLVIMQRRQKLNLFNELPTAEPSCPPSPAGEDRRLGVTLCEVRARGRFGAVWRAALGAQEVAVKVFPAQERESWLAEQEIFRLPRMSHPDVLRYIGVEKRGDNIQAEYWLITAYHEKGSLCDYLKANTVTWGEVHRIAHSMARGLTHLHDEVASGAGARRERKPAIAHRDFKSKNVLLKADMSACIADFGLALVFQPGRPCGDTHGQVGTRRYMAPEVLEGAINFTRDAFLRIDMYACGLVLWEIVSRCSALGNMGEYMLPLEEEVGAHPSLEEMQDAVVHRKMRPNIPQSWRDHNALSVLCDTMEECWDHDAEARLSASCVMERIRSLDQVGRRPPLIIENARPL